MAKSAPQKEQESGSDEPPVFSDKDKSRARQWFKKAQDLRERRDYDYAIKSYLQGLEFWTDAVEEGHMPLWSLAIQRQQAGGKKPGTMERLKNPISGKDAKKCMLNAEHLMAKDPTNAGYLDGLLKNAKRADLAGTLSWIAPKVFDSMRKEKKPSPARFKAFRQVLVEAARRADQRGDPLHTAWCYEQAVNAVDYLVVRNPTDMALKDEQRDLSGRLTIARGKYEDADSFRDSLVDAEKQKLLHDAERAQQSDQTLEALIAAARQEYEADPTVAVKINAYVTALLKPERKREEAIAIDVLTKTYEKLSNYSFKERADDVRLRQLRRKVRRWHERAEQTGSADDQQQFRLVALEEKQTRLDIFRERVRKYPTNLRLKFHLGSALFHSTQHDEAIPLLQEASADPRSRVRARLMIGRAFFESGSFTQAAEVLAEALESHDVGGDDISKEMLYWIGRANEAGGNVEEALATFGKLLRQDYNYANGDARKRHDTLKNDQQN